MLEHFTRRLSLDCGDAVFSEVRAVREDEREDAWEGEREDAWRTPETSGAIKAVD